VHCQLASVVDLVAVDVLVAISSPVALQRLLPHSMSRMLSAMLFLHKMEREHGCSWSTLHQVIVAYNPVNANNVTASVEFLGPDFVQKVFMDHLYWRKLELFSGWNMLKVD